MRNLNYKKMNNTIFNEHQVGYSGCDYATTGTVTPSALGSGRWFGFVVNETAVIASMTLKNAAGTTVSFSPTWLTKSLAAGQYVSFGVYRGEKLYCTSIVVTSGSVLLYID